MGYLGRGTCRLKPCVMHEKPGRKTCARGCLQISNRLKLPQNPYGIHGTKRIIYLHGWLMFMVNVGKYTIHGWYGKRKNVTNCWFASKSSRFEKGKSVEPTPRFWLETSRHCSGVKFLQKLLVKGLFGMVRS